MQGEFNEFDLNVFFSAKGKGDEAKFVYENEVQKWLDLIRGSYLPSNIDDMKLGQDKRPPMPYSDTRLLNVLSHTLWFLPNVASCQAMYNLMMQKQNAWFNQRYEIIVCAGAKAGIGLDGGCIFCQSIDQVGKEACLQVEYTFLCSRDFLFVFLEFLGDVSLSLSESLFSDPLLRNLILIRIAYLQVISKYIVVSYLQALNARSLGLSLLNVQEILLAVEGHLPEFIQFRVHSFTYHVTTVDLQRSIGIHLSLYTVADVGTELHSGTYLAEGLIVGLHAFLLDGHHGLQGIAELNDISGVHTSRTHSSDDSF